MRYDDIRAGFEIFGKSLGRVLAVIICCAPAVIGFHIVGDGGGDWDWLVAWGGMGLTAYWLLGFFDMLGVEERHEREIRAYLAKEAARERNSLKKPQENALEKGKQTA